ncbi:amino acid ABC transporter permease [Mesorhizobium sp. AaZ16]|uniref:amino acid ABC transporter permease n=1 Tax=Mesorhizobium sp. AaZ16 TaxID=3402289 RepID=UPI00374F2263
MSGFTFWDILWNLILAARWTIVLSLVTFVFGSVVGLSILFMRISRGLFTRSLAKFYIEIFQGTPLLMQLFLAFFGLALFGIDVPAWLAATLGLTLWSASFFAEIWRGCVQAVSDGQREASASLGLGWYQTQIYVVFPQAILLSIPPTVGFLVQIVKATALTSIIGFTDLLKAGSVISNNTFEPFLVYGLVALLYFLLCWPLSLSSFHIERKLNGTSGN